MKVNHQFTQAQRRLIRVRSKIKGTDVRPRLTVFRSNKHLYLQAINDQLGKTLAATSDAAKDVQKSVEGQRKMERAKIIAKSMSDKLKTAKITAVVFDRGSYRYHGAVKLIAEELRNLGIQV
ncbi:MAG: 50S ribosomal protein L18 [Patescibacteria group bacterium]